MGPLCLPDAWVQVLCARGTVESRHTPVDAGEGCRAHAFCSGEKHKRRPWGHMIRARLCD